MVQSFGRGRVDGTSIGKPAFIAFLAGEIQTILIVQRHTDGTMTDETGVRVLAWEYLRVV